MYSLVSMFVYGRDNQNKSGRSDDETRTITLIIYFVHSFTYLNESIAIVVFLVAFLFLFGVVRDPPPKISSITLLLPPPSRRPPPFPPSPPTNPTHPPTHHPNHPVAGMGGSGFTVQTLSVPSELPVAKMSGASATRAVTCCGTGRPPPGGCGGGPGLVAEDGSRTTYTCCCCCCLIVWVDV